MTLTCLTCSLIFSHTELHRKHFRSSWHSYNLKRKIAGLSPISEENFERRAESSKEMEGNDKESKPAGCRRRLVDDIKTGKLAEDDDDGEWESCDESDDDLDFITKRTLTVETNDCLFCNHQSHSTEDNVSHMRETHSFFIPEKEKLVHLDKFIGFLAVKIHFRICLWCNGRGKQFKTVECLKKHMIDKGHCKILFEGKAKSAFKQFYEDGKVEEIEDFNGIEKKDDPDEDNYIEKLLKSGGYELKLPCGAVLGHRSLSAIFKQNLKALNYEKVKKFQQYKSLGYTYAQHMKRYNLKLNLKQNKLQTYFRHQTVY